MITPEKVIIPLDVLGDTPYLKEDGLHTQCRDHSEIAALTGVAINEDGKVVIDTEYMQTYMDAAPGEGDDAQVDPSPTAPKVSKSKGKVTGKGGEGADRHGRRIH